MCLNNPRLIKLNQDFYKTIAKEFDKTRQYFWQGWGVFLPFLESFKTPNKTLNILDLACGNGRLAEFLEQRLEAEFYYLGVDSDPELLFKAKSKFEKRENINFLECDLFKDFLNKETLSTINSKTSPNLITAFGIIHHLPAPLIKTFFASLKFLLKKDGILIFSVWDFINFPSVKKKIITDPEILTKTYQKYQIDKQLLGADDYFLSWNKGVNAVRYCRYYSHSQILETLENSGFKPLNYYQADGKEKTVNRYYIAKIY